MKKINIIDVLILLLIIGLIFAMYIKFGVREHTKAEADFITIEYTMKVSSVRKYTVDLLKVGDYVYDSQTKIVIGFISKIEVENSIETVETSDGRVVNAVNPNKYDITLTILCDGMETDKGYYASRSIDIKVGDDKQIETLYVKTYGTIMSMNIYEEEV